MDSVGALLRCAEANDGLAADDGRVLGVGLGLLNRVRDGVAVIAVNLEDLPAVGGEARRCVLCEPAAGLAVNRDAVVIPEGDEAAELEGSGEGAGLVGDALHQAAVAHEHVGVVVNDLESGTVEVSLEDLLGKGHADRVGDALPERAGGSLDAVSVAVLRMSRGLGVELAEVLEILHAHVVAGEMEKGVEEHGAVAVRKDETVAVIPLGLLRIVLEETAPENLRDVRHSERYSRMAGLSLLNRIHAEGTDRVCQLPAA